VSGSALAISRDLINDVGMFDDAFFMYAEEIDLCFRAIKSGYQVIHIDNDDIKVFHKSKINKAPPRVWYYLTRNMLRLINKQFSGYRWLIAFSLYLLVFLCRITRLSSSQNWSGMRHCFIGLNDALHNRLGRKSN
jgi:GT2 family glycosyltransferase